MDVQGHCDPAFGAVRDAFAQGFDDGEELGAAVAVYSGDRPVVDLWGGVADRRTGRSWRQDTPCLAFSCTKAVTATAALLLAERDAYDVTGPVSAWWPEFAVAGKEGVTAEHLLSHQTGLPAFDRPVPAEEAHDPAAMAALLAAQAPEWAPGEAHGYHALTYGWLAGEIVRRHAGRPVGAFVADEVAGGLDLHVGATDDVIARAAKLSAGRRGAKGGNRSSSTAPSNNASTGDASPETVTADVPDADDPLVKMVAAAGDPNSLMNRSLNNPMITKVPGGNNNPAMLRAGWPAMGMVTTASALAGFYRDLLAGRILRPDTLTEALRRRVDGPDRVMFIDSSFGLGFMRPSTVFLVPPTARDSAFGHTGLGGSIGVGDVERDLAIAYIPNRLGDEVSGGLRAYRLVEAAYASVG